MTDQGVPTLQLLRDELHRAHLPGARCVCTRTCGERAELALGSWPATAATQAHMGALNTVFAALLLLLALKSAWRDTAAKSSWQD